MKYDRDAVRYLEGFIEGNRGHLQKDDEVLALTERIGAVFEACLMARYGGRWGYYEALGRWGIRIDEKAWVFPFTRVYRQFRHGPLRSILGFYDNIAYLTAVKTNSIPNTPL